jgi:PPOX class probable F420-dependent enzyme
MADPLLAVNRPDDAHTGARLTADPVIWLGTTGPNGRPHHVPVWFCWRDPRVLLFSMPGTRKLANLRRNPLVTLNLDSAAGGQDIVLAEGHAELPAAAPDDLAEAFAAKYTPLLGSEPALTQWRATFSVPVLITVTKLTAWTRQNNQLHYRTIP